jgi:hypothetical protein
MRLFLAAVLAAAVFAVVPSADAQSYKAEFKNSVVVGPTGPWGRGGHQVRRSPEGADPGPDQRQELLRRPALRREADHALALRDRFGDHRRLSVHLGRPQPRRSQDPEQGREEDGGGGGGLAEGGRAWRARPTLGPAELAPDKTRLVYDRWVSEVGADLVTAAEQIVAQTK